MEKISMFGCPHLRYGIYLRLSPHIQTQIVWGTFFCLDLNVLPGGGTPIQNLSNNYKPHPQLDDKVLKLLLSRLKKPKSTAEEVIIE